MSIPDIHFRPVTWKVYVDLDTDREQCVGKIIYTAGKYEVRGDVVIDYVDFYDTSFETLFQAQEFIYNHYKRR